MQASVNRAPAGLQTGLQTGLPAAYRIELTPGTIIVFDTPILN